MFVAVGLGLLIGLALGSLGGGGSILAVPVLAHIAGQSAVAATSTSLVAVGVAAAVAAVSHARADRVRWDAAAAFLITGIAGTWAGSTISGRLDGNVLLLAFSGLVLAAAYRMLTACPTCTKVGEAGAVASASGSPVHVETSASMVGIEGGPGSTVVVAPSQTLASGRLRAVSRVVAAGSVVGFLTGLFGVGGGFVIVPALTLALGLTLPVAIGTSLVVIAGNAAIALGFRGVESVDWGVAIPFTATMLVGSTLGAAIADRLPPTRSLQAFAALLVAVAIGNGIASAAALLH